MRTVGTISLNGNAWQIETEGCQALAAYLQSAETRLAADPDREEILADLEQAIADKLLRYVSAHKNVVTAAEVTLALKEMGPVETGAAAGPPGAARAATNDDGHEKSTDDTRYLFRIQEGGMLGGVCNGLAAYFGIDVNVARVIFVLFAVFTGGIGAAVYLVMMIVIPPAITAEQMAQAHGKPFSAEELIGRPRAAFDAGHHWRQQWRDQRRLWREQRRQWRRQRRGWSAGEVCPRTPAYFGWHGPHPGHYGPAPVGSGPIGALIQALMLIAFLAALMAAVSGRPLLGWDWEAVVPHWVGIVAVCVIYGTLANQVRIARYYGQVATYNPGHVLLALVGTVVWLLILLSVGWYVVHHWPAVQDLLQRALQAIQSALDNGSRSNTIST